MFWLRLEKQGFWVFVFQGQIQPRFQYIWNDLYSVHHVMFSSTAFLSYCSMPEAYFKLCANHHISPSVARFHVADMSLAYLISTPYPKEKESVVLGSTESDSDDLVFEWVCMHEGRRKVISKINEFKKNLKLCAL